MGASEERISCSKRGALQAAPLVEEVNVDKVYRRRHIAKRKDAHKWGLVGQTR